MDIVYTLMGRMFSAEGVSLLTILGGTAFVLFGLKLYRVFSVFAGMVLGGVLGGMVAEIVVNTWPGAAADFLKQYEVVPPVAGAIVCGILALTLSRMALGIVIGACGFYFAFQIGLEWGLLTGIVAAVATYTVLGFLAAIFFNKIIICASSLTGSAMILAGVLNFLNLVRPAMFERVTGGYSMTMLAAAALVFIIGVLYQSDLEKKPKAA